MLMEITNILSFALIEIAVDNSGQRMECTFFFLVHKALAFHYQQLSWIRKVSKYLCFCCVSY